MIGTIVRAKAEVPGLKIGSLGLVYDIYPDSSSSEEGWSIIFDNEFKNNFSFEDRKKLIESVAFSEELSYYEFETDFKLIEDLKAGKFNKELKETSYITYNKKRT